MYADTLDDDDSLGNNNIRDSSVYGMSSKSGAEQVGDIEVISKILILQKPQSFRPTDIQLGQCKILASELILTILQKSGPPFRSDMMMIAIVRTVLCVALLENCTSHDNDVVSVSLQIFVTLMDVFR